MSDYSFSLAAGIVLKERYRITRTIGMGGFGITYEVYDMQENRKCAVKEFVPRGIVTREEDGCILSTISPSKQGIFDHGKERFMEEAQILNRLRNVSSVVSVYDFFNENGTCYFVMEFLEGAPLNKLVKALNGKMPLDIVLNIAKEVGEALCEVHKYNIFHRDISPDNIFITMKGEIKLIDFGNAKNLIRNDEEKLSVVLKPGFAPLEQYSSKGKQGRYTDVYALASTIYYVLTGHKIPDAYDRFKDESYIRLSELGYPKYISDAIDHALKLLYKERTQTVEDFLVEMRLRERKEASLYQSGQSDQMKKNEQHKSDLIFRGADRNCPVPYIRVLTGKLSGKKLDIPVNTEVIIGRTSNTAHIVFDEDRYISKKHCVILYNDQKQSFYICDHSTNGTFVNGKKLVKGNVYMLPYNTKVSIGNHICTFEVGADYGGK